MTTGRLRNGKCFVGLALATGTPPRTLQRFVESLSWDEEKLRDRCQVIVAQDHAHPQAIGLIDESGVPKSGNDTAGAARQWCGYLEKVDNCVVMVHTAYATDDFHSSGSSMRSRRGIRDMPGPPLTVLGEVADV